MPAATLGLPLSFVLSPLSRMPAGSRTWPDALTRVAQILLPSWPSTSSLQTTRYTEPFHATSGLTW